MGNLDSKFTPYYSIIDENKSDSSILSKSSNDFQLNDLQNGLNLWTIKKANFNNVHKNSLLYEFNYSKYTLEAKKVSTKHLKLALNQIKYLKTLRHPNIVKYFYSEEPQINSSATLTTQSKCILITESLRPLSSMLNDLSKEQLFRGIYGITCAISFLHEKVLISHNNISESSIYLNSKQTWKLSDFELALSFSDLNTTNLKSIHEFKSKNSITPEEEGNLFKIDLDQVYKRVPHALDAYAWAMLLISLIPSSHNVSNNKSQEELASTSSTSNIIENLYQNEENSLDQLEIFLSKDPSQRPTLKSALNLSIFDLCKDLTLNNSVQSGVNEFNEEELNSSNQETCTIFDPFKLNNLNDLDQHWYKLVEYLGNLTSSENEFKKSNKKKSNNFVINEKLIDFLLSPHMFFSDKIKEHIFPSVFIPKEEFSNSSSVNQFYLFKNYFSSKFPEKINESSEQLKPFIDLDKYKAFVLPRILNLFSMHSVQIRLVLLDYFPFYISLINDQDTLKYEILPELLLGLKDKNDDLVSLTFSCLSIMVKLLGSEIVVGKSSAKESKIKLFSDNIPKSIQYQTGSENLTKNKSVKNFKTIFSNTKMINSNSLDDEMMINMMISSNDEATSNANKIFTDSMIALHDDTESTNDTNQTEDQEKEEPDEAFKDDEWLNDFDWNRENSIKTNINESRASLVSLAGSLRTNSNKQVNINNQTPNIFNQLNNNYFGSEFDIKNINIVKKVNDQSDDLIESFLNEMKPEIKIDISKPDEEERKNKVETIGSQWECDEEINLDEL